MNIVHRNMEVNGLDWEWFNSYLPVFKVEDTVGVISTCEKVPVAAMVLDNHTGNSVQAHMVIAKPMAIRHGLFELWADILFNVLECAAVFATVPSTNAAALKLNSRLGFTEVTRLKNAYAPGVDSVILEMTPEQCKFYEVKDGQEKRQSA